MFKLFKKKKEDNAEVELPPPPMPPEAQRPAPGKLDELPELPDIEPVFPEMEQEDLRFPEFPEEMPEHIEIPQVKEHPTFMRRELQIPDIHSEERFTPKEIFDRTIKDTAPSREAILQHKEIKPMFVAVDDYSTLQANTNFVRTKLIEAEEYLQRLTDLKNQELKAFDKWKKTLEQAESKLSYVDKIIAEAQG